MATYMQFIERQPRLDRRRRVLRPMLRVLGGLLCRVDVHNLEHIPDHAPTVLLINHISFIDPIVLTAVVTRRYVISMAKAETLNHWFVGRIVRLWGNFVVRRDEIDRIALNTAIELLKAGHLVLIAAEGTRNPDGLGLGKSGAAFIAHKSNAVVVPTAIVGAETWAHDLRRLQRASVQVRFGQPFRFHTPQTRLNRAMREQMITEAMYQIARQIPDSHAHLRGHYVDLDQATSEYLRFI
jgi:1-acyl-sn-glycerol-3-phosphate acyltransferase